MAPHLKAFDRKVLGAAPFLIGIDEAGRGCLAGPVVAAAVRFEASFYSSGWARRNCLGVNDSKLLRAAQRDEIVRRFGAKSIEEWIQIGIGSASVEEIAQYNIHGATTLAMRRALGKVWHYEVEGLWSNGAGVLSRRNIPVLIDGRPIRAFPVEHQGVVKGDRKSLAIALAGIHAKEWRDAEMRRLAALFPEYGFDEHKGYGTDRHVEALGLHGITVHHRKRFLVKYEEGLQSRASMVQDSLF